MWQHRIVKSVNTALKIVKGTAFYRETLSSSMEQAILQPLIGATLRCVANKAAFLVPRLYGSAHVVLETWNNKKSKNRQRCNEI